VLSSIGHKVIITNHPHRARIIQPYTSKRKLGGQEYQHTQIKTHSIGEKLSRKRQGKENLRLMQNPKSFTVSHQHQNTCSQGSSRINRRDQQMPRFPLAVRLHILSALLALFSGVNQVSATIAEFLFCFGHRFWLSACHRAGLAVFLCYSCRLTL
jgi:hypothetical protein